MTPHKPFDFSATDLCVKCGLCLPHCPTYRQTQSENESPRGRLALIDGWSRNQLKASETLNGHLDRCLLCRSCESVCPANVPYGEIIDAFRQTQMDNQQASLPERLLLSPKRSLMHRALALYQRSGLQKLLRITGLIHLTGHKQLDELLPKSIGSRFKPITSPGPAIEKTVSLFTGCATEILDPQTLTDSVRLIKHCGYAVHAPTGQPCCGALDQHSGRQEAAETQRNKILNCFNQQNNQPLICVASGCGATLMEHPSPDISQRTVDICNWLLQHSEHLKFRALKGTALLHTPCTLKNVMQQASAPAQLLKKIPHFEISQVTEYGCCGAAGTYMLDQPEMAKPLREHILGPLTDQPPDYLLTSNIGCALHLQAGLRDAGLATQVLHPVSLLAQQLVE